MEGEVQCHSQGATAGRRLYLAEALRLAVLRGETVRVHQLLCEGAPLVTDTVECRLSFTLINNDDVKNSNNDNNNYRKTELSYHGVSLSTVSML